MIAVIVLLATTVGTPDMATLEHWLSTGRITPEQAVAQYCSQETTSKQMDAFCACPEDAVQRLREALGMTPTS